MSNLNPALIMIALDTMMIIYSLWAMSGRHQHLMPLGGKGITFALVLFLWMGLMHFGLESQSLFPKNVSGPVFLAVIFGAVGLVGAVLFGVPSIRHHLINLRQEQLMLLQGIRVFFGASFLMSASTGVLPQSFGIIDGFTHIGAGFFGLIAAYSLAADVDGVRRAWFANLFGLADILIVASSLALILLPQIGPHHSMMYAVFLPAPLWLWFHVISITKLLGFHKPHLARAQTQSA